MDDQLARMLYLGGCLVLAGSWLMSRGISWGTQARMAAAWLLIFGAGIALYGLRDNAKAVLAAVTGSDAAASTSATAEDAISVPMARDGHFWLRGTVNGIETEFLVDSGASMMALSARTAERAGVASMGRMVSIDTANGQVQAMPVRIERLAVGPVVRDHMDAVTAEAFGETDVIGMNFLSSLRSWSVSDGTLVLRP